jgi:integrase
MNYLVRIKGHYFFRTRIPKDLCPLFSRKEVKKSLHTQHLENAKVIAKAYSYRLERIYTIARGGMMTDAEVRQLMHEFVSDTLRDFEEGLSINPTAHDGEKMRKAYLLMAEEDRESLVRNDIAGVQGWLDGLIEERGLEVSRDSVEYHRLGREMLKARQVFWKVMAERETGNYDNDFDRITKMLTRPACAQPNEQPQGRRPIGTTLSQAFDRYIQQQTEENGWDDESKGKGQLKLIKRIAVSILGDKDIGLYTRQNALDYRSTLLALPLGAFDKKGLKELSTADKIKKADVEELKTLSRKTVNEYTARIRAVFATSKHDGLIINQFTDLKMKLDLLPEEQRQPYSIEDIKALLASPAYTIDVLKTCQETPHQFWIPLMALFTGARMNELCSLNIDNVIDMNGIPCIEIARGKKKRTKTKSSERIIPIHQALLNAGFMRYVGTRRAGSEPNGQLWPLLKHSESTGFAGAFNQWFGEYNRKYITQEEKKTFHSFRHTFITALSECNVEDSIIDRLDGHAATGTGRRYGKGRKTVETLYEQGIKKLEYKGMDFSGIKAPV